MFTYKKLTTLFSHSIRFISTRSLAFTGKAIGKLALWSAITILAIVNLSLISDHLAQRLGLHAPVHVLVTTIQKWETSRSSVLGITSDQKQKAPSIQSQQSKLEEEYTYWQTVVSDHTQYRDGYIILARLALALDKPNQMRFYIDKALQIDPNNQTVTQLKEFVKQIQ